MLFTKEFDYTIPFLLTFFIFDVARSDQTVPLTRAAQWLRPL